mmetsp:Transcript_4247/g.5003  ORF Transcript_4247/g.5003 Transcript_4247/m.5003 type:complete len:109 (-) Transcript_4247:271-597(-)
MLGATRRGFALMLLLFVNAIFFAPTAFPTALVGLLDDGPPTPKNRIWSPFAPTTDDDVLLVFVDWCLSVAERPINLVDDDEDDDALAALDFFELAPWVLIAPRGGPQL